MSKECSEGTIDSCDKELVVMQVIRTALLRRGTGDANSPIRAVVQYWSMQGDLLAEVDPLANLL